jgi:hypothetical protein
MNHKDKLDRLVESVRLAKKPKEKNIKELTYWTDTKQKFYPNHPNQNHAPKDIKIYEAIIQKIDRETSVSACQFIPWVFENWENLEFDYPFPNLTEFNKKYVKPLDKFIKIKTQFNYNTRSGLPSLRARKQ